jgi:hypothetical protein
MSKKPSKKPLGQEKKLAIANLIDEARVRELRYVDTVLQKAYLAAFQCLDKRIEAVEKLVAQEKKDEGVDLADFFVDVVMDILLGRAGGYLKDSVESMLRPIVRSRQTFYKKIEYRLPREEIKKASKMVLNEATINKIRTTRHKLRANFTRDVTSDDYGALINLPLVLIESSVSVASNLAQSQINLPGPKVEEIKSKYGYTPIVRILISATGFYNEQHSAVELTYSALKNEIMFGELDEGLGTELEAFLTENASSFGVREMDAYGDRLFQFYEASMWANVTNIANRVQREKGTYLGAHSENAAWQETVATRNYELESAGAKGVVFTLPEYTSGTGPPDTYFLEVARWRISLPKDLLDYLIKELPWRFDVPQSKSIYDEVDSSSRWQKDNRNYTNYVLIKSYRKLVGLLTELARELDQSWLAVKSIYEHGRGPPALTKP